MTGITLEFVAGADESELLRQHRLLAIGHGPLPAKIFVLRQLIATDCNHQGWQDDLRAYEERRLRSIEREGEEAFRRRDYRVFRMLFEEINDPGWTQKPGNDCRRKFHGWARTFNAELTDLKLPSWLARAEAAHKRQDFDAALRLRDEYLEELEPNLGADVDEQTMKRVRSVLDWVDAEIAHWHQKEELRERRRRTRRILSGACLVALALMIVVPLIAWLFREFQQQRELKRQRARLEALIDADEICEADDYHRQQARVSEDFRTDERVRQLRQRLDKLIEDDEQRRANFQQLLQQARSQLEHLDPEILDRLQKLMKTTEEKQAVQELLLDKAELSRKTREQLENDFLTEINELRARVSGWNEIPASQRTQRETELRDLRSAFDALLDEPRFRRFGQHEETERLRREFRTMNDELADLGKKEDFLTALTDAVGQPETFFSTLRSYAEKFPDCGRSVGFQRVAEEEKVVVGFLAWNDVVRQFVAGRTETLRVGEVERALGALDSAVRDYPGYPQQARFDPLRKQWESMRKRTNTGEADPIARLRTLFGDPLFYSVWMIETPNGERYYTKTEPKPRSSISKIIEAECMQDEVGAVVAKQFDVRSVRTGEAPQSMLASSLINDHLSSFRPDDWEESFYRMLERIHREKRMDPVLTLVLLERVFEAACSGSYAFEFSFQEYGKQLRPPELEETVNWLDPSGAAAVQARKVARSALPLAERKLRESRAALETVQGKLNRYGVEYYVWIGWLRRNADESWDVFLQQGNPHTAGALAVVIPNAGKPGGRPQRVGQFLDGHIQILPTSGGSLVEGRPVFLLMTGTR